MSDFLEFIREILVSIDKTVGLDRPGWRIFSLIISPIAALVAFYLNQRSRKELKEQAQELGVLQERVNTSQQRLADDTQLLKAKDAEVQEKAAEIAKLQEDISLLTERSHELWKIRPAASFTELTTWHRDPRSARVVACRRRADRRRIRQ